MKKMIALSLSLLSSLCFATQSASTIFDVTISKPNLTIIPNVNFLYSSAGIQITSPGFAIDNTGQQNCTPIPNGFCLFTVSPAQPKTLTVTGNGNLTYKLCTNGDAQLNCQNYVADFSGSEPINVPPKAYVATASTTYTCDMDANGVVTSCSGGGFTGATPDFSLPLGMTLNTSKSKAYVTDGGSNNTLYNCDINLSGTVTSCSDTNFLGATPAFENPFGIAFNSINNKVYVIDRANGPYTCEINARGEVTTCAATGSTGTSQAFSAPSGISYNEAKKKVYIIDTNNATLYTCDTSADGIISSCSNEDFAGAAPAFSYPLSIDFNGKDNKVYATDAIKRTLYTCDINASGVVTSCSNTGFTGATRLFSNPFGVVFNAKNNKVYVIDGGNNTLYNCEINASGVVTSCSDTGFTGATPDFENPYAITSSV